MQLRDAICGPYMGSFHNVTGVTSEQTGAEERITQSNASGFDRFFGVTKENQTDRA
jgi:hypothetical protein